MGNEEKRKSPRIESPNLLSYVCLDENNNEIVQGMGRTLNVSEGGILLETHVPIDPEHKLALTICMENDLMYFKGKVAHSMKSENGKYASGIQFIQLDEQKRRFLRQYMILLKDRENLV